MKNSLRLAASLLLALSSVGFAADTVITVPNSGFEQKGEGWKAEQDNGMMIGTAVGAQDAGTMPGVETITWCDVAPSVVSSGNVAIAVCKFVAAYFSHSAAMLAEAVHSLSDTGNQVLLLIGMRLALRAPDDRHPFGRQWRQH